MAEESSDEFRQIYFWAWGKKITCFAALMKLGLEERYFGGNWYEEDEAHLIANIERELEELWALFESDDKPDPEIVKRKAVDLANRAMMLADKSATLCPPEDTVEHKN